MLNAEKVYIVYRLMDKWTGNISDIYSAHRTLEGAIANKIRLQDIYPDHTWGFEEIVIYA